MNVGAISIHSLNKTFKSNNIWLPTPTKMLPLQSLIFFQKEGQHSHQLILIFHDKKYGPAAESDTWTHTAAYFVKSAVAHLCMERELILQDVKLYKPHMAQCVSLCIVAFHQESTLGVCPRPPLATSPLCRSQL